MKRLCLALLAASCLGLAAADDKKPDGDKKPATLPNGKVDWGAYVDHGVVKGEVDKLTDTVVTVAVTRITSVNRGKVNTKVDKIDYSYHDNALVRWAVKPTKLDNKGKKAQWTEKELKELKAPTGSPGFAATRADLAKDAKVELHIMRPKGVTADKLVSSDYKIKYAVILDPPPAGGSKPADKDEKKEDKKGEKKAG